MSDAKDKTNELKDAINETYRNFQKNEDKLEGLVTNAKAVVDEIMLNILGWKDVFEHQEEFYKLLASRQSNLSEVEGHLQYLALETRKQREIIRKPDILVEKLADQIRQRGGSEPRLPTTINLQTGEPQKQKGGSFYDWRIAIAQTKLAQEQLKGLTNAPTLTAAQKPRDILDYATDIIPEFNKLANYFYRGIAMTETFPNNKETRVFMNRTIRNYWLKFSNVTTSITRASVEYRKELSQERAVSYALALTLVEQARVVAEAGGGAVSSGVLPTSGVQTSQTYTFRKPKGGPYPKTMSSGVEEHE